MQGITAIEGQRRSSRSGAWADSVGTNSSVSSWGDRPERRSGISSEQRQANRERMVDQAIAAGQNAAPAAVGPAGGFRIGEDVLHGKWGEGVVLDLQGSGDKTEITINFPTVGQKVLLLAWAPLKKV